LHDFIVVGCDGVFDKLSSEDVVKEVWKPLQLKDAPINLPGQGSVSDICGFGAERVMRQSMLRESSDNLSVIVIAFKNFAKHIEKLGFNIQ
jgi:serine/threonine protein phosphatase PrpC